MFLSANRLLCSSVGFCVFPLVYSMGGLHSGGVWGEFDGLVSCIGARSCIEEKIPSQPVPGFLLDSHNAERSSSKIICPPICPCRIYKSVQMHNTLTNEVVSTESCHLIYTLSVYFISRWSLPQTVKTQGDLQIQDRFQRKPQGRKLSVDNP